MGIKRKMIGGLMIDQSEGHYYNMEGIQSIVIVGVVEGTICQSPDGEMPASLTVKISDKRWDACAGKYLPYPVWVTICLLPSVGRSLANMIGTGVPVAIRARFIRNTWNYAGADAADQPFVVLADEIRRLR